MREIKFKRVFKNRNTGEISYMEWGNIDFRGQSVLDFSSFASPGTNSHSSPVTDLQYTGLKDKNGKDIYEGDLVKLEGSDEMGKVVFERGAFYFDINGLETEYLVGEFNELEVIGNEYAE